MRSFQSVGEDSDSSLLLETGTALTCPAATRLGDSRIPMIGLGSSHVHSLADRRAHVMHEATEDEEDKMEKSRPFKRGYK